MSLRVLVLGVLAVSWAHCLNSSKDTLPVLLDCTLEAKLAYSLRELFPFPITFLYRAFWSASLSFVCPTFKTALGKCTIMFVLPMYNIILTSDSTVLIHPRHTNVIGFFYLLRCFSFLPTSTPPPPYLMMFSCETLLFPCSSIFVLHFEHRKISWPHP